MCFQPSKVQIRLYTKVLVRVGVSLTELKLFMGVRSGIQLKWQKHGNTRRNISKNFGMVLACHKVYKSICAHVCTLIIAGGFFPHKIVALHFHPQLDSNSDILKTTAGVKSKD